MIRAATGSAEISRDLRAEVRAGDGGAHSPHAITTGGGLEEKHFGQ